MRAFRRRKCVLCPNPAGKVVEHPFDTIKVKLQAQHNGESGELTGRAAPLTSTRPLSLQYFTSNYHVINNLGSETEKRLRVLAQPVPSQRFDRFYGRIPVLNSVFGIIMMYI